MQVTVSSDSLTEELEVVNGTNAETPLTFTTALHTYFRVSDVSQTHVEGLSGLKYLDNMQNRKEGTDEAQVISVNGEIDRIYVKAPDHLQVNPSLVCCPAAEKVLSLLPFLFLLPFLVFC